MPTKIVTFTNSGIYTPSAGVVSVIVECIGGGGAGGWVTAGPTIIGGGGGGGSGSYSRSLLNAAQIGSSQPVTIGASGTSAGGTSTSGGTTSFGTLVTANGGGAGGGYDNSTTFGPSGAFGITGNGQFTQAGNAGGSGITYTEAAQLRARAGFGAAGPFGGMQPFYDDSPGVGHPGISAPVNTGAGGSGGVSNATTGATVNGGNGGSGVCVITEYAPTTA